MFYSTTLPLSGNSIKTTGWAWEMLNSNDMNIVLASH